MDPGGGLMGAFAAFWVGCAVGAVVGIMSLALVTVARDAEQRAEKLRERTDKDEKESL